MLDRQEILDLYNERYEFDCHNIRIVNPVTNKTIIEGPGFLRQSNSKFEFKLFANDGDKFFSNTFLKSFGTKGGNKCIIFGAKGREWTFRTFAIGFTLGGGGIRINGSVNQMSFREPKSNNDIQDYIRYYLFSIDAFPFTGSIQSKTERDGKLFSLKHLQKADFEDSLLKIDGIKSDGMIILDVFSETICKQEYPQIRIKEALQFILGQKVQPGVVIIQRGENIKTYISSTGKYKPVKIKPPINIDNYSNTDPNFTWKLFSSYLNFVGIFNEERYHPIGAQINGVIGSGNSFLETKFLVLSVAIEGILVKYYEYYAKADKNYIRDLDNLIEHVLEWNDNVEISKRVQSAILAMKKSRAKDKLVYLVKCDVIEEEQLKSWNKLRNKSAHGLVDLSQKPDSLDEYRIHYNNVLEMFYRLIFNKIGYNGIFNAYSKGDDILETFKHHRTDSDEKTKIPELRTGS